MPGFSFDEWEQQYKSKAQPDDAEVHDSLHDSGGTGKCDISEEVKTRAVVASVAEYYEHYVHIMKLDKFFRNDTVVVSIRQVKENEKFNNSKLENARWMVHG